MEKWKKKIIKYIYKQWIKTDGVSMLDLINWLGEDQMEITKGIVECSKHDLWIRFKGWILRWDNKAKKQQT